MTKLLIDSSTLTDIADAIRDKEESSSPIQVSNMATRIENLPSGGIGEVESVTITNKSAFQNLSFSGTYLTIPLAVTVLPANAPQITQVVVSDPKIAKVLDNGDGTHSLHIMKGGTCQVTVYDYARDKSDNFSFTINQALEDISFAYASRNVAQGGTLQLAVQFKPATATDQTIVWSSSNEGITIDQNGLVTATNTGHTTISAYSAAINKTITCSVECAAYIDTPDWAQIKADVASGQSTLGVGSTITDVLDYNGTTYNAVWRVMAYQNVTLPNGTTKEAMILMMTQSLPFTIQFSQETTVVCDANNEPTALADTYYYGNTGSTYTRLNVEVGDTLPYADYTRIIKSGLCYTKNFNSAIVQGYINRWDGSMVRAMLNSDADNVGASYTPVHITDRCDYYTGKGFLQMVNPNMLNAVQKIKVTTKENNSCFDAASYETEDLFWIPSECQVYSTDNYSGAEGAAFQYYIDQMGTRSASAADCRKIIPLGQSAAAATWLRAAYAGNPYYERCIYSSGSVSDGSAGSAIRVAPACAIC